MSSNCTASNGCGVILTPFPFSPVVQGDFRACNIKIPQHESAKTALLPTFPKMMRRARSPH